MAIAVMMLSTPGFDLSDVIALALAYGSRYSSAAITLRINTIVCKKTVREALSRVSGGPVFHPGSHGAG
jgi:hypothetical protein